MSPAAPYDTPLVTTVVAGIGLAFVLGTLAHRLRMSPIVGYLAAGVVVGPLAPGSMADPAIASQLAEIGVILLMFGVGLHFSLADLLSVRAIAIAGAGAQMTAATALGAGLALSWGWPFASALVFGLALSAASTVVLTRALQERRLMDTEQGRIAVGWLIIEDLVMVLALVMLPALATVDGETSQARGGGEASIATATAAAAAAAFPLGAAADAGVLGLLAMVSAKVAAFVALMLMFGRRLLPRLLHAVAHTGSRELFRLAVLSVALSVAFGASKLFGASFALGAFFAGMVLSESRLCQRAAEETLPLRDAFAVLFFVSVGMLVDPAIVIRQPLPVLGALAVIVLGNGLTAAAVLMLFRRPLGMALAIGASLAQIGEFSFILADLAARFGLLSGEGRSLILAGAILSITLNPLLIALGERLRRAAGTGGGGCVREHVAG